MSKRLQPRYDEELGIYRDCKWCYGNGCLACPREAEKAYHREFPDGPQPVATFTREQIEAGAINGLLGQEAIEKCIAEAKKLAVEKSNSLTMDIGLTPEELVDLLAKRLLPEVLQKHFVKVAEKWRV